MAAMAVARSMVARTSRCCSTWRWCTRRCRSEWPRESGVRISSCRITHRCKDVTVSKNEIPWSYGRAGSSVHGTVYRYRREY
eukprot:3987137-Pyramimonas_sp.AAC.2